MFLILLLPLLLLLSALFLYWLAIRHTTFWRRQGIAGPKPTLLSGNLDSLFGDHPSVLQLQQWTKQFGRVYGIQEGWYHVLVTSEPEMVHQLLVDKFEYFHARLISAAAGDVDRAKRIHLFAAQGKRWKRLRTIATPAFSVTNLKRVMPIIDESIRVTMGLLDEARLKGKPVNLHTFFTEMTFDVISRVAMGQRESSQFRSPYSKLAQDCLSRFNNNNWDYFSLLFPWFGYKFIHPFLSVAGLLLNDPIHILIKAILKAVAKRKQEKENGKEEERKKKRAADFIDLFLEMESSVELTDESKAYNKADKFEKKNTIEEIAMNCFLFLLAGFDTTANSLSLICHNLAIHPEVQQKLWEEVNAICGGLDEEEEPPSYEQLAQLKYTEAVVKETLRLCPIAAPVVNRLAAEETTLGGIRLEKGTAVKADLFTLHRDPAIWGEDAGEFRPERWLESGFAQPSAYYPFGGGPRICIGMRFAMMEEKMALAHLVRRFNLRRCAETEMEPKLTGQVVLNPSSVIVQLETRLED